MARPKKSVRKRMHILCEGEKTEPFYIKGYVLAHAPNKASVISVPDVKYNTPIALVDEAIRLKNSRETSPGDEFWVVYDREAVSKYAHELHLQARNKANKNNIHIGLSNICFELWLLQHFGYRNTPYSCCDDLLKNSPLKADLIKARVGDYTKGDPHLFTKVQHGVTLARARAAALNRENLNSAANGVTHPHMLSAYTDIHLLLDAIDAFKP